MRQYDFEGINQAIPIEEVLNDMGCDTTKRQGKIPCPSPNHTDKRPSAIINGFSNKGYSNTCYCFSCQKIYSPIGLVQEYMNSSVTDASDYLISRFGLGNQFCTEEVTVKEDDFPLSYSNMKLLGLKPFPSTVPDMKNQDVTISLRSLYQEDKSIFYDLVLTKCHDKKENLSNAIGLKRTEVSRLGQEIDMLTTAICTTPSNLKEEYEKGKSFPPKSIEFIALSDMSLLKYYESEIEKNEKEMSDVLHIENKVIQEKGKNISLLKTGTFENPEQREEEEEEYEIV